MDKLLSIIIPSYNMEKYLEKDLNSLVLPYEIMSKLEIIIVNDGSTDKTSLIAHDFESKYKGIAKVIDKRNGNYGSCVNAGLSIATGMYVKILDADDSFDTGSLKLFIGELEKSKNNNENVDVFFTDFHAVDEDGKQIKYYRYDMPKDCIINIDNSNKAIFNRIQHHGITYRRSLLVENNYFQLEGILYTDQEWITIPLLYVKKVKYIPLDLYVYLLGRSGQSMDKRIISKSASTHIKIGEDMLRTWLNSKNICREVNAEIVKKRLVNYYAYTYRMFLIANPSDEARGLVQQADTNLLRMSTDIYKELDSAIFNKRLPIKYVKMWRKNKDSIMIKTLTVLYHLKSYMLER